MVRCVLVAGLLGMVGLVFGPLVFADSAQAASVVATVDLSKQRMHVSVDGKPRYSWTVSTGKKGWRTPTGSYRPIAMYRDYYSKRWNMELPHLVMISQGGVGIHGTHATHKLGRPASHGCIRLHPSNAKKFYDLVSKRGRWNTHVSVVP